MMKKLMFLLSIVVLFSTTSCLIGDSSLGDSSAEIKGTLTVFNEDNSISYEAHNASITVAITKKKPLLLMTVGKRAPPVMTKMKKNFRLCLIR